MATGVCTYMYTACAYQQTSQQILQMLDLHAVGGAMILWPPWLCAVVQHVDLGTVRQG